MHQVVDPSDVDRALHPAAPRRARPPVVARAGIARRPVGDRPRGQRATIVHEAAVPRGSSPAATVDPPRRRGADARSIARAARAASASDDRFSSSASASSRPTRASSVVLEAAALAGPTTSQVVVAGGEHPRLAAARRLRRRAARVATAHVARFTGWVPDADVARWFAAADVALFPYPKPFAASGALGPRPRPRHAGAAVAGAGPLRRRAERAGRADRPRARSAAGCTRSPADPARSPSSRRGRARWPTAGPGRPSPASTPELYEEVIDARPSLLVGAFGQGNPGDEALCAAFRRALPTTTLIVASRRSVAHGPRHRVRPCRDGAASAARLACRHRRRRRRRRDGLQDAAPLDRPARRQPCCATRRRSSRRRGRAGARSRCVGVGADDLPGREARPLARWLVRHTDLLVLRDEESAAVLAAAGAPTPFRVGADPAWTLLGRPRRRRVVPAVAEARSRWP